MAGLALKFNGSTVVGDCAVRWDAAGHITELGMVAGYGETNGFGAFGSTKVKALNASGVAVGTVGTNPNIGTRPVRWAADGTATPLQTLGTNSSGVTYGAVDAINAAGTAVGQMHKYSGASDLDTRAVRWDAAGNATKTGSNDTRAVRWELDGSATVLGTLYDVSTSASGTTSAGAYSINDNGDVVGYARSVTGPLLSSWYYGLVRDPINSLTYATSFDKALLARYLNKQGVLECPTMKIFELPAMFESDVPVRLRPGQRRHPAFEQRPPGERDGALRRQY